MTIMDDLLAAEGPIASVYLRAPSDTPDARYRLDTRWKNVRRALEDADAPDDVLGRLDAAITDAQHDDAAAFALFAAPGREPVTEPLDDALHDDLAAFDRLPLFVPMIHVLQRSVPHVMVTTDRTGADIVAVVDGDGSTEAASTEVVDGTDHHIHRGRFGGWSHRRIQQRAENRWEDNARDVADRVADVARRVNARVVTVAGDVRACQFLMEHLDDDVRDVTTVLEVGEPDAIAEETVRLVADAVARDTRDLLDDHASRMSAGTAAVNVGPVFNALAAGRVEILLVVDDIDDDRVAYFSPDGSPVCSPTRSYEDMVEARLVDVAVRSALLADADVRVVPATVLDGDIGALLRW